jgi:septal ring factor EnvC (AmiA/AmiB activator)
MTMNALSIFVAAALVIGQGLTTAAVATAATPTDDQLATVRNRISKLEADLGRLSAETESVERKRQQLDVELNLADARVREVELLLERSSVESERLRREAAILAADLEQRRQVLDRHLEIMALLGRPGPLQLFVDAYRGGTLEDAVGTVSVLTAGQIRLFEEYREARQQHGARLAELSLTLSEAREEAGQLESRQRELERVRREVANHLATLERDRASTGAHLDDLREREASLERLVGVLSSRQRFTGHDDIRGYRGALPWPVEGPVVQSFGRRKLANYSAYTICNGLRFDVPGSASVSAVFPGVVAYAQYFKGYGNMVVLDHGNEVYSLVAGLGTIHVRVDQSVTMGMRLGLASPPAEGGNVYLEIRVNEKPEDPRRWLQLKGGSS